MKRPLLLFAVFVAPVVLAQSAVGPSATDLYHSAAQAYIAGEQEQAVRDAERGLALDPGNEKLEKLLDLLRQQQPPQDGDDGQQNDPPEEGDEGEPQDQQGGQGENEPERDEAERDGTQQDQGEPEEQDDAQQGRDDQRERPSEPTPADAGQRRAARMSAGEAQRLLDAVAADEELLVERMRRPTPQRRSDRDW